MTAYLSRTKNRKLKKTILNTLNIFKFRSLQVSNAEKVILFGSFVSLISLFFPWVSEIEGPIQAWAFSNLTGRAGILIVLIIWALLFIVFSKQKKEKLKKISNLHFRNYLLWIVGGLFISISSLSSLSYISWLQTFSSNIIYGQWPILCLVGWILIWMWGILLRKEEKNGIENVFTEEKNNNKSTESKNKKDNMMLPF